MIGILFPLTPSDIIYGIAVNGYLFLMKDEDGNYYQLACEYHRYLVERETAIVDMGKKRRAGWCRFCLEGEPDGDRNKAAIPGSHESEIPSVQRMQT